MSEDAESWTTVAACKVQLGITDTTQDAFLESLVNRSYKILETFLGRKMKEADYVEYYDGPDDESPDTLLLNQWPIIEVESIHDDLERLFGSDSLIAASDMVIYKERGLVKLFRNQSCFQRGAQNIKVAYTAGYATMPGDLEDAAIQMVEHMYNRSRTNGFDSASLGGKSETYDKAEIPAAVKRTLRNYKVYCRAGMSST
jgi:hypothetical protein